MKRRDFLKTGLKLGVAVNTLPVLIGGRPVRALGRSPLRRALETTSANNNKVLVIVQLQGGNDGLNCLVPYTDSLYKQLRPTLGLDKTADNLLVLPDHNTLAFHGAMTGLSTLYAESKVAILQNVGYATPSLSHFRGTDIWNTATDPSIYASTGWIGRYLLSQNPGYPPQTIPSGSWPLAVEFGNALSNLFLAQTGGMGVAINQMPTASNPSTHHYDAIPPNPTTQYNELAYVRIIQEETEIYAQTIGGRSVSSNNVTYPTGNALATDFAGIAQMIKSQIDLGQVQTKIYLVTQGSYDTHSNELTGQAKLLGALSDALLAFQQDLEAFGIADQVAIMTYSEFGRRPKENGSGTDHGTAAPHFVISTQVIPGVHGSDPKLDTNSLIAGNLAYDPQHEFRNVYTTMLNEWLMEGGSQTQIDSDIRSILTADTNGTYSTNSNWTSLGIFKAQPQQAVAADPNAMGLTLMENYPNPASGLTTIEYALPASGPVELGIFSTSGAELERIIDQRQEAGLQRVSFNTSRLASGAYIYRLKTATGEIAQRMIVEH